MSLARGRVGIAEDAESAETVIAEITDSAGSAETRDSTPVVSSVGLNMTLSPFQLSEPNGNLIEPRQNLVVP